MSIDSRVLDDGHLLWVIHTPTGGDDLAAGWVTPDGTECVVYGDAIEPDESPADVLDELAHYLAHGRACGRVMHTAPVSGNIVWSPCPCGAN